jgi:hypothetical protein
MATICKIYDRPAMEYPIYKVEIGDKKYFIQRMDEMNSGSAWYQVRKKKGYWSVINDSKSKSGHNDGFLAFTKADAIKRLEMF